MGACVSSPGISEEEKSAHREAERAMREQKAKLDNQVKVRISLLPLQDLQPERFVRLVGLVIGIW